VLRHAQATHSVLLDTHNTGRLEVAYRLDRAKRRSIGFMVNEDGLAVKAPRWVSLVDIQKALQDKSPWILRKLNEVQIRAEQSLTQRIQWADGGTLQLFGEPVTFVLDPTHAHQNGQPQLLAPDAQHSHARLVLHLPHGASPTQIRDAAKAWLLREAKQHFTDRLNYFAPQLAVRWTRLTLSNAGTRWGSAKIDGSIRLHWRLIHFKPSIIDYVVVHELSHLRVMDHSPRFWDTVALLVPDYAQQRKHLRTQHLPKWE
jgi:predicted metal-dependent hydrolase